MFGEDESESPRLPSPWQILSRSATDSPSPLSTTASSVLGTPEDDKSQLRRQASYEAMLAAGLGQQEFHCFPSHHEVKLVDGRVLAHDFGGLGVGKLGPEVDKKGHIEYKLKLPTPNSPHRLAKLITQLRWRLVEGGGVAMYELGVLDSGVLVGLSRVEMDESLQTLGRMLAGLGGGEVRISRVVQVGGQATLSGHSAAATGLEPVPPLVASDCSSSDGSSVDGSSSPSRNVQGVPDSPGLLFKTFTVDAIDPTCYNPKTDATSNSDRHQVFRPTHPNPPLSQRALPLPIAHGPGPVSPYPERSFEERLRIKRMKRDARRLKRQQENERLGLPVYPFRSAFDLPSPNTSQGEGGEGLDSMAQHQPHRHHRHHGLHHQHYHQHCYHNPRVGSHEPTPKTPTVTGDGNNNSASSTQVTAPSAALSAKMLAIAARKPRPATADGEVRYVVEAVVTKRVSRRPSRGQAGTRRRRRSSVGVGSSGGEGGDGDGGDFAFGLLALESDQEEDNDDEEDQEGGHERQRGDNNAEGVLHDDCARGSEEDEDEDEDERGWSFLAYESLLPPVRRGSVGVDALELELDALARLTV